MENSGEMTEYKPIDDDGAETVYEYMQYGFRPQNGPVEFDPDNIRRPIGDRRGLYTDDGADPVAICRHYWFDVSVRGRTHPGAGLTSVITPPEHRRNGYVSDILSETLVEYEKRGRHFSILRPFDYGFYRSFGWDTANEVRNYDCPVETLSFAAKTLGTKGEYRQLGVDSFDTLAPVYESFSNNYSLTIERDAEWWRHRVCYSRDNDPYVYAWFKNGEPRAYLVFRFTGDYHGRTMHVREFAYTDEEALHAVLAFCYNHDSQADTITFHAADDTVFRDLLESPDKVECTLSTGPMVRVVDVESTLSALSYPNLDADVVLAVSDAVADWNDGRFRLTVTDGVGHCETTTADSAVRLDIAALSQLAVGHRSATDLSRSGRLEGVGDAIATLDRLFPSIPVYIRDRF